MQLLNEEFQEQMVANESRSRHDSAVIKELRQKVEGMEGEATAALSEMEAKIGNLDQENILLKSEMDNLIRNLEQEKVSMKSEMDIQFGNLEEEKALKFELENQIKVLDEEKTSWKIGMLSMLPLIFGILFLYIFSIFRYTLLRVWKMVVEDIRINQPFNNQHRSAAGYKEIQVEEE